MAAGRHPFTRRVVLTLSLWLSAGCVDDAGSELDRPDQRDGAGEVRDGDEARDSSGEVVDVTPPPDTAPEAVADADGDDSTGCAAGSACDDGDPCSEDDRCVGGACAGTPKSCPASGPCSAAGVCNPASGLCEPRALPDGTPCDDGARCTGADACRAGRCDGTPRDCDDGVACTVDSCSESGGGPDGCSSDPTPCPCTSDADCRDADACDGLETCDSATLGCVPGSAVSCLHLDGDCAFGACDPPTGLCLTVPRADDLPCEDGDLCTSGDVCGSGLCRSGVATVCNATDDCHQVGLCNPASGVCSDPVRPDNSACDDGLSCTTADRCRDGVCGGSAVVCDDQRPCSVDNCVEAVGGCSTDTSGCACETAADCDDHDPCNGVESCGPTNTCRAGTRVSCGHLDSACALGVCNPSSGECTTNARAEGTGCDDDNACTTADACHAGLCKGGNTKTCTASDQCHLAGSCNPDSGVCSNPPKANGLPCTDGDLCTQSDSCQNGLCQGASPVSCPAPATCHGQGTCDPATGACSDPALPNNSPCNDNNACTRADTCQGGSCVGASPVACTATSQCTGVGTCNTSTGVCSDPPRPNTQGCDDGLVCTTDDHCQSGLCTGGGARVCDDGRACSDDSCDEAQGGCVADVSACDCLEDIDCDDFNACSGGEICALDGSCENGTPISCAHLDGECVIGTCTPFDGSCSALQLGDDTACDDGNACTANETCLAGDCRGGSATVCNPKSQCHVAGTCNPASGLCSEPTKPNGSACNDGDPCSSGDDCQAGVCDGDDVVCTALDDCHLAGTCSAGTGQCSNPTRPNDEPCNDGSACTAGEECQGGNCSGGTSTICTADGPCTGVGTCNPQTGVCSDPPLPNSTPCNADDDACTSDSCQGGQCQAGAPKVCTPPDECHGNGVCDEGSGICGFDPVPGPCDDGDDCTEDDACDAGACTGGDPIACSPLDQCHLAGTCSGGVCSNPSRPNNDPCDDVNACTTGEACQGGSCSGGTATVCSASGPCRGVGSCNTQSGVCSDPPLPNNTACDADGSDCTAPDTCQGGSCAAGSAVVCAPPAQCRSTGSCDPDDGICDYPIVGGACSDGTVCTTGETCSGGSCGGGSAVVCTALDECHNAGTCSHPAGCSNPNKANNTACSPSATCQARTCQDGVCTNPGASVCDPGEVCDNGTCPCDLTAVSFVGNVRSIFVNNCSSCHDGMGVGLPSTMNLTTNAVYTSLVNVDAVQCSDATLRVEPGNVHDSYVMRKLLGQRKCGGSGTMPPGGSLSQANIATIARWICQGAEND